MNRMRVFLLLAMASVFAASSVWAEVMDRPVGVKIGQRMTLKPYVAVSGAYDSNVDGRRNGSDDFMWTVSPGFGLEYRAENWSVVASGFYQYNGYAKNANNSRVSYHSFGENVTIRWTDSKPGEKGWSLLLTEKYTRMNQAQSMLDSIGRDYSRDRDEFQFAGSIERRFGYNWHASVNGSYYWLNYDNNNSGSSYGLYGWERWGVGGELGYAASHWTDILLTATYMGYDQDNVRNSYYSSKLGHKISSGSRGVTVQGGLGSYATEKITYRVLGGWSLYQYKNGGKDASGFTYTAGGNWKITETWTTMLVASSYYQPSEREYGSASRIDTVSWGLAHLMVRGKLTSNFDVAYRRETREYSAVDSYDYDLDNLVFRLGLNYTINRYLGLFSNLEYFKSFGSGSSDTGDMYSYDRFRVSLGVRFTY